MITHHALCIMRLNYMKIIESISTHKNNKRVISIDISNKITEIPPYAFNGCDSIKTIYIPDSVKKSIAMRLKIVQTCQQSIFRVIQKVLIHLLLRIV